MYREKLGSSREGISTGHIYGSWCGCPDSADVSGFVSSKRPLRLVFGGAAGAELMDEGEPLGHRAGLCHRDR